MNQAAATLDIDIVFTPAAKAVERGQSFQLTPPLRPYLLSVHQWDMVNIPPCSTPFVVASRQWTLSRNAARLVILLDLVVDSRPGLAAVPIQPGT